MSEPGERLTADRERAIRARLAAITPGPWRHQNTRANYHWSCILADIDGIEGLVLAEVQNHDYRKTGGYKLGEVNAAFIAAAPSDVRALLAEIERLRAELGLDDSQALAAANDTTESGD